MIGIIGAMPEEVQELLQRMSAYQEKQLQGLLVYEGRLAQKDVIVVQSEIGKVNAAITTTLLIAAYHPEVILNIGSAGGLKSGQKIGDLVIADKLQYHDFFIGAETYTDQRFIFVPSASLLTLAQQVLDAEQLTYHQGLIVSGDQFVVKTSAEFKNIQKHFPEAIAVEMEATAIAAACEQAQVPYLILRSLSDIAAEADNDVSFAQYLKKASQQSALLCEHLVANLGRHEG